MESHQPIRLYLSNSSATKALIELASFLADLEMTRDALDLYREQMAIRNPSVDAPDIAPHLLNSAAVSYWRCFSPSKVRKSLLTWIEIPAEHLEAHDLAKSLRHDTVAHSSSNLLETHVIALLFKRDGQVGVESVTVTTKYVGAPSTFIDAFSRLVDHLASAVQSLHDEQIEIVDAENRDLNPSELWNRSVEITLPDDRDFPDWDPRRRRVTPNGVIHFRRP